ncbi:MAG TPA: pyruvate synthase subunit beta, partial [Ruminococcus sp.]|nr:pyruvate synthase subunit beta [Ruminococcus sp.]
QGRFKHLDDADLETILAARDRKWAFIEKNFTYK